MAVNYPGAVDSFSVPSLPESVPLSEAGSASRSHTQLHKDTADAVVAVETNAAFKTHDHSGDGTTAHGNKLAQANTHESADTDVAAGSKHHTLGTTQYQAAAGNHTHDWNASPPTILNRPEIICTSITRPVSPYLGLKIWEVDTNAARIWAQFPQQTEPIWQLLGVGTVPILRVEARFDQAIAVNPRGSVCIFDTILEDIFGFFGWGPKHEVTTVSGTTDVVVTEPGHYHIHAAICWAPYSYNFDNTTITITVNGIDVGANNWQFVRGNGYVPGFSQTNEIYFPTYLNAGDVVRVMARHNAPSPCWLYFNNAPADYQVCHMEIIFHGP